MNVTNAGNYTVVITSPYGSITSAVATLTVAAPAAITHQPSTQTVAVGSNPTFSVAVAGSGPFDYEWYFDSTNLVQSGSNNTLALFGVSTNNTGSYTVIITNAFGSVTSQVATLTVALPPTVIVQPGSQTNLAGTTVNFNVTAGGIGPFTYQWQFNGTNFPNNIITTVAGKSTSGFSGDGGGATNASLSNPSGVAFDLPGNLYIADRDNNRIRKVDTNGIITTVAGNGNATYAGDGGKATNASLYTPARINLDVFGNLYISDQSNSRIRKVGTNGIITTVAGSGNSAYAGDGGLAVYASLAAPCGVSFDVSGNLFIGDIGNNRIRKVDGNGIITTVAGNGLGQYAGDGGMATNASLYAPFGVAFDASSNMYIPEGGRIRKVDTNGIITTVAGGGVGGDGSAATNASLSGPQGVAFDASGNLYIADWGHDRIRKVDTTGIITTVAGGGSSQPGDGGPATNASLILPTCIAFDVSGNMYVAGYLDNRIHEVHFTGFPTLLLTNVSGTNAGNYSVVISSPYGSVTSVVATLTVIVPPQIITSGTNFGFTTNQSGNQSGFGFNLSGTVSQTIVVDGSTNMLDWTPLFTNTVGTNSVYFFDPTSTNLPGRFYRARLQ